MARASNYSAGDTVIFNRQYKTLGVEKDDEREVARVDYDRNTVWLDGGRVVIPWPGGRTGLPPPRAEWRSTGAKRWSSGRATGSGGHATIRARNS